jgi:hypothetical protein
LAAPLLPRLSLTYYEQRQYQKALKYVVQASLLPIDLQLDLSSTIRASVVENGFDYRIVQRGVLPWCSDHSAMSH